MLVAPIAVCVSMLLALRAMYAPPMSGFSPSDGVGHRHGDLTGEGHRSGHHDAPHAACHEGALSLALALAMLALAATCLGAAYAVASTRARLDEASGSTRRSTYAVEGATRRLSAGWCQHTASDGRVFYSHRKSGRVQWTAPLELNLRALEPVPEA